MPPIVVVGLSHRTAGVNVRSRCAAVIPLFQMAMRASLRESVVLSTCNRLEIYVAAAETAAAAGEVQRALADVLGVDYQEIRPHLYILDGREAVQHLMRVAAGLESRILGENQILGQVTQAYSDASAAGTTGAVLDRVFATAIHAGKRVHTETGIGRFPTSLSHTAVMLLERRLGDLAQTKVLLIGAGKMAALTAEILRKRGVQRLGFINRTLANAEALAANTAGRIFNSCDLTAALQWADAVITATGSPEPVLHARDLSQRDARPLLIIDMGAPRNVAADVAALDGVEYAGIDQLDSTLDQNLEKRRAAVPQAERIVEDEIVAFILWWHNRSIAPLITDLRRKVEQLANSELELALSGVADLDPEHRRVITRLVHRVTNKLLHEPTVRLKSAHAAGYSYSTAVRHLFALGDESSVGAI